MVSFSSSHPHLVQNKPKMQLAGPIGGILYTRTSSFINFNEPSAATNVEVNVHSSHPATRSFSLEYAGNLFNALFKLIYTDAPVNQDLNPGTAWENRGIDTRKLRLYPYLKFQGLTSSKENQTVNADTTISYAAKFSYAHPDNGLTKATFSRPKFRVGTDPQWHTAQGSGWPTETLVKNRTAGQKDIPQSFVASWPTNSILNGRNVANITVRVKATPDNHSCVKGMTSDYFEFRLKNPNYVPNASIPTAQPTTTGSASGSNLQRAPSKIAPVKPPQHRPKDPR